MHHLPDLWYPRCRHCGRQATDRAGLGDASGPRPVPHETLVCEACGRETRVDERTSWIRRSLEVEG